MESTTIKVGAAQTNPKIADSENNLREILSRVREAARTGTSLIVFPECALTGYCFSRLDELPAVAEPIPGPSTTKIASVCIDNSIYAVVGLIEVNQGRYFNSAVFLGPDGIIGSYRKVHPPFMGVDRFVADGDRPFQVFDTKIGKVGLAICYDVGIPESVRVMALDGAEIIAAPTNWPQGDEPLPQYVVNARCFENRINLVACDRVGTERGHRFIGRSKIVDYLGNTLAEASSDEEEIIYAYVDPTAARNKKIVVKEDEEYDRFKDRRPQFYRRLTEETG